MPLHTKRVISTWGANKGAGPGHPYADVVFSYAFHNFLESIAVDLDNNALRPLVPTANFDTATQTLVEGSIPMPIVAVFDDFVIPVITKTPGALRGACSQALGIVADNLARRGMSLNAAHGKTEAVLTFHGSEASLERHRVFETSCPPISSSSPLAGDITIGVARTYKHLGTLNTGPDRYEPEVLARIGHSNKMCLALKKKLFNNRGLPRQQRLTIWKALVLSSLIYHCATWIAMTINNWKTM